MMWAKGFAAEETKAAFARAAELAAKTDNFCGALRGAHGQWALASRGELRSAREMASTFLKEAENAGRVVEAGVARRGLALHAPTMPAISRRREPIASGRSTLCDPEHDQEARERFGEDTGTIAMSWLALTSWQLGEVERARELIDDSEPARDGTRPRPVDGPSALLEILSRNTARRRRGGVERGGGPEALSREHGMAFNRSGPN